jgi:DNA-binding transcriptional ArsR family regulator
MKISDAVTALAALAQETRLGIFRLLVEAGPNGLAAGTIGERLKVPAATLSFHLKELARAGLATARHEKTFVYYAVDFKQMADLMGFLTQNCCKGMPQECFSAVEMELSRCCAPRSKKNRSGRSR